MFSTQERLKKRTPAGGINREEYIEHLVEEFHTTSNVEAQEQVTANLSNFAYDPINYSFFKKSGAIELFLQILGTPNDILVHHSIAGICNLCLDEYFHSVLIQPQNLEIICTLLHKNHTEIVINTITTLALILDNSNSSLESTKELICKPENIQRISKLRESNNLRVKKIASVFMEDYCSKSKTEIIEPNLKK